MNFACVAEVGLDEAFMADGFMPPPLVVMVIVLREADWDSRPMELMRLSSEVDRTLLLAAPLCNCIGEAALVGDDDDGSDGEAGGVASLDDDNVLDCSMTALRPPPPAAIW